MSISDNILSIIGNSPHAIIIGVAGRVKQRRLESALTQKELAKRADIPLPTYRRFERTGKISFPSLVMLGIVLGMTNDFSELFATKTYRNMDELLKHKRALERKRGRKNG